MGDLHSPGDVEVGLLTETKKESGKLTRYETSTCRAASISLAILALLLLVIFTFLHEDGLKVPILHGQKAQLNLLVVGDWGREGLYNQSHVAAQMDRVGSALDIDFVVSAGDNFYDNGLADIYDDDFKKSFSDVYNAKGLLKPWFAVLGNHDYRGNVEAQVDDYLKLRDSRWFCDFTFQLSFPLECTGGAQPASVDFFFIDTNPFQEEYWTEEDTKYNWTRFIPREEAIIHQLQNLSSSLQSSAATWKVVIGHHTMYSYGPHGNTNELIQKVLPTLEANNVDLWINGHDHCLQHIKRDDSPVHFVTSGGGSKAWKGVQAPDEKDLKLYYDGQGFISLSVFPTLLHVNFYDINGLILHTLELPKN